MTWDEAKEKYMGIIPKQKRAQEAQDSGNAENPSQPEPSRDSLVSAVERGSQEMEVDTSSTPATPHREVKHEQTPKPPHEHQQQQQHEPQYLHQIHSPQHHQHHQMQPNSYAHVHSHASSHPQLPLPPPISPRTNTQMLPPHLPPAAVRQSVGSIQGRTPLPSTRNRGPSANTVLPSLHRLSNDLHSEAARIINNANPHRSRYDAVHVMLLVWSNEDDPDVLPAVYELKELLETQYGYFVDMKTIPAGAQSPFRWLLHEATLFVNSHDLRGAMKILYYAGCSYLNREREMVLSSSADKTRASTIPWSGIQKILEDSSSDVLVLMDAAYYPCSTMVRREGVLEILAASVGWDATKPLGRVMFTRAVMNELQLRHDQPFRGPLGMLSAAELHVRLMDRYYRRLRERHPDQEYLAGFPAPLHMQVAANARLPSIYLAPCHRPMASSRQAAAAQPGSQLTLTVRVNEGGIDKLGWTEWMRLLPAGISEVRCEGLDPSSTFR